MNKINCSIQSNRFEDLTAGTIFAKNGGFYIKIDRDEVLNMLEPTGDCDFEDFEVDRYSIPNAISLQTGAAVSFNSSMMADMVYPNATISFI